MLSLEQCKFTKEYFYLYKEKTHNPYYYYYYFETVNFCLLIAYFNK